jgi:DNA-binding XRE family transcriptional regulator
MMKHPPHSAIVFAAPTTLERRRAGRARRRASDPALRRLISAMIAARVHAGLTQQQVAVRFGTKKSAISRLESGASNRSMPTTLENYALAVGCRVEITVRPFR